MSKIKVALSACLMGSSCRYDGNHNFNEILLKKLANYEVVTFCPEDYCFGTPRPTMDLIEDGEEIRAVSNETNANLSLPIKEYGESFFQQHPDIKLFIGKDKSPSCGVGSTKLYNSDKIIISYHSTGLMAKEAIKRGIKSQDATLFASSSNL